MSNNYYISVVLSPKIQSINAIHDEKVANSHSYCLHLILLVQYLIPDVILDFTNAFIFMKPNSLKFSVEKYKFIILTRATFSHIVSLHVSLKKKTSS